MPGQARQLAQADAVHPHRLRLVTGQALLEQVARQHHLDLLAHVAGGQAQLGDVFQLVGAEARLLLELAVGRHQHVLTRFDQALGQRQLIVVSTAAVFLHQHRMLGIEHRHHHHRTIARALADQTFVGALRAVGEAQLHFLDTKQTTAGDYFTGEYRGLLTHGADSLA